MNLAQCKELLDLSEDELAERSRELHAEIMTLRKSTVGKQPNARHKINTEIVIKDKARGIISNILEWIRESDKESVFCFMIQFSQYDMHEIVYVTESWDDVCENYFLRNDPNAENLSIRWYAKGEQKRGHYF